MRKNNALPEDQQAWMEDHYSSELGPSELARQFNAAFGTTIKPNTMFKRLERRRNRSPGSVPRHVAVAESVIEAERLPWAYVDISDVHHGRSISDQRGKQTWGHEQCEDTIRQLAPLVVDALPQREYAGLVVKLVGDIVDGEDIFPSQHAHVDMTPHDQVAGARQALWEMLTALAAVFGKVRCIGVMGNHGRTSKRNAETSNYDLYLYQQLQLLASMRAERDIDIEYSMRELGLWDHDGARHMLIHHGVKQCGTAASQKKLANWANEYDWHFMSCAHFHSADLGMYQGRPIFINGTACPRDDLADRAGLVSRRQYWAYTARGKRLLSAHPLCLD